MFFQVLQHYNPIFLYRNPVFFEEMSDSALELVLAHMRFLANQFRCGLVRKGNHPAAFIEHLENRLNVSFYLQIAFLPDTQVELSIRFDTGHTCLHDFTCLEFTNELPAGDQSRVNAVDGDKSSEVTACLIDNTCDLVSGLVRTVCPSFTRSRGCS